MDYGEKVLDVVLANSGGVWADRAQILATLKKHGGDPYKFADCVGGSVIKYHDFFTTRINAKKENLVALELTRLIYCRKIMPLSELDIRKLISEYEKKAKITLDPTQRDAVVTVVSHPVCLLIGGPGTGKTTVTRCIVYVKKRIREMISITLTAPTGKAANRLSEATGEFTCTLHKKLYGGAPIIEDCIFVDESSMLDLDLAGNLLSSLPNGKELVLIGDTDQLPSVGTGAILRDFIASGIVPVARLTKTFRQSNDSVLFSAINNIKNGVPKLPEGEDFHPIELKVSDNKEAVEAATKEGIKAYRAAVSKYGADNVAFLIPFRAERIGFLTSEGLNPLLQEIGGGCKGDCYSYGKTKYYKGDLVIQLENRIEAANGDVGKVTEVTKDGIKVRYSQGEAEYSGNDFKQISLAYSMSIHKSQGSEYAHVIMVCLNQQETMLQRNLIYTGITRAKKECTVIYQQDALNMACAKRADQTRTTFLAEKIQRAADQYRAVYGSKLPAA